MFIESLPARSSVYDMDMYILKADIFTKQAKSE